MDKQELKDELRDCVHNTMDFCGPVMTRAFEYCKDEGIEATSDEIGMAVNDLTQEYGKFRAVKH